MAATAELIDRAAGLPPGPELSAALAGLPWHEIPNARLVEVLQARSRQLAHDQAELFAGMAEITRADPVADLPGPDAVARTLDDAEWASHEIAAALTWTPTFADRELAFATVLVRQLPLVFAALRDGRIDRGRAWVFAHHLDPGRTELTPEQIQWLCARFVPLAPGLTTRQLSGRLLRAIIALDPGHYRRRYERAVCERGIALHLDRDGTATLAGAGLPPAEAAAAAARLDRLAAAAKRARHPGRLAQISADLYLGMLDGSFHGLTEPEILARLHARPEDHVSGTDDTTPDAEQADSSGQRNDVPTMTATTHAELAAPTGASAHQPTTGPPEGLRWAGERVATREGVEIRVGVPTLLAEDDRPGEIPGLGPVDACSARTTVAAQQRGARWQFAVVGTDGHLLLAGPLRRRPRTTRRGRVRGGVVELHLTLTELHRLAVDGRGEWGGVIAEIAARWADRRHLRDLLGRHPDARFARGALARHVHTRDRTCVGPGCTRPARRSQLDHTHDHAGGGTTVESNIGPGCVRHHPDKNRGWTLTQPEPGHFEWVSPLGRVYRTRGEPIRPDLPDPEFPIPRRPPRPPPALPDDDPPPF